MGSSDDNSWKLERNIPMRIPLLTLQPSLPIKKKKKKPKKVGREFMKESPNLEMEEVDRRIWVHLLPHDHTLINKKVIQQTQFIHWDLLNFSDGKTVEKKQIGSSYFVVEPNKESRSVSPYRRRFMPLHVFSSCWGFFSSVAWHERTEEPFTGFTWYRWDLKWELHYRPGSTCRSDEELVFRQSSEAGSD